MPPKRPAPKAPRPAGLSANQKGMVAESAHDLVVTVYSRGRYRGAKSLFDDHGVDRVVFDLAESDRALLVNPKGALTRQKGGALEFRIPLWEIPRGGEGYFVVLAPLQYEAPWIGPEVWAIPGKALLEGRDPGPQLVVRVREPPDPESPWDAYRRPRESLAGLYADTLGAPLLEARNRSPLSLSETAQAFVLETALNCHLTMGSEGQLRVWRPLVDDQGLDSAVNFEGSSFFLGLQPKGALKRDKDGLLQVHVPVATFHPGPFNFLVILEFDPDSMSLGPYMWLIPSLHVAKKVKASGGTRVFRVSPDPRSTKDNFLPYRHPTESFPAVVAAALAGLERGALKPGPSLTAARIQDSRIQLLGRKGAKGATSVALEVAALRAAVVP